MSYILEALKKSDRERQRGHAPGLQTVQTAIAKPQGRGGVWLYLLVAALLFNAAVLGWWLNPWRSGSEHTAARQAATVGPPPGLVKAPHPLAHLGSAAMAPSSARPAGGSTVKAVPGGGGKTAVRQPASIRSAESHQLVARTAVVKPRRAESRKPVRAPALNPEKVVKAASRKTTVKSAPAAAASSGDQQLPLQLANMEQLKKILQRLPASRPSGGRVQSLPLPPAPGGQSGSYAAAATRSGTGAGDTGAPGAPYVYQLPAPMQRAIPQLSLSFLVYSKTPQDRMVSVNGKMLHEGQPVSPGLTLQKITPDGAIFSYHGQRFFKGVF